MSPSYFTLTALLIEAIVFLYNRQVAAMLSMHPSCSGRSSAIENKLKMSGGGNGFKHFTPGNVSFPVACLNHPKNLKAVNGKASKFNKALPMNSETLKNDKVDLNQKVKDTGNGVALEHTHPSQERVKNVQEVTLDQNMNGKEMNKGAFERYLYNPPYDTNKMNEAGKNEINEVTKPSQEKVKNDLDVYLIQKAKELGISKREAFERYLYSIPLETKVSEGGKNKDNQKATTNKTAQETNPMFHSQAGMLAKKIKEYIKNTEEFQNQTGMIRRGINREYTFDASKDDSVNLLHISNLFMALNENERDSPENLKNASDLFMALHECYQVNSVIPLVFDVEMVLKKLEEEGNKVNPIKLLEYFRENAIKYPLLDLLKIKDPKDNFDEKIENFKNIIHKSDNFLDKNMIVFVENDNEMFLNEIDSRIETADFDFKLSEKYSGLKHLKPIEKHDLLENSELLQKLHEKILPGDEMMKF
uniref:Peripheral plastid protein 1 n=1 Tax=Meloidogyne hapla TaxID=6305 RepID=A0A1I8BT85_MELHA